ncbi:hypothetical protein ACRAWF_41155, partial [Streptomyces sp. L7]
MSPHSNHASESCSPRCWARSSNAGPDSAGVAVYGDPRLSPPGRAVVSLLGVPAADAEAAMPGTTAIAA